MENQLFLWPFSIAMLNYQRVVPNHLKKNHPIFPRLPRLPRWANGWQPQWLSGGGLHDVLRSDMGSFLRRGGDQWLILHGYEE